MSQPDQHDSSEFKRRTIERLLNDEFVLLHVMGGHEGVSLPPHLLGSPSVTLKVSRLFRGSLKVEKQRLIADLLFNKAYFSCVLPFSAIWAATSVKGATFDWRGAEASGDFPVDNGSNEPTSRSNEIASNPVSQPAPMLHKQSLASQDESPLPNAEQNESVAAQEGTSDKPDKQRPQLKRIK